MNILSVSTAVRLTVSGFQVINVGNVPVAALTFDEALELICSPTSLGRSVHFVNANSVVDADEKSDYANVLRGAWLNLPDGTPVAWSMRRQSSSDQRRVPGPDIFAEMLDGKREGIRHFLIGSTEDALARIQSRAGECVVGFISPPRLAHHEFNVQEFAVAVTESQATHVWIGLGSPKQDFVAVRLAEACSATVLAVGAAFDFSAGTQKRAPIHLQRAGLEWLYRLLAEPRRLWKRYLVGNVKFLLIARK